MNIHALDSEPAVKDGGKKRRRWLMNLLETFEQDDPVTSRGNNTGQSLVRGLAICSYAN